MTCLDNFIDTILEDKQYAYELLMNLYNGTIIFIDNKRKINFCKQIYKYNDDKDEDKLNELCNLFKNFINSLIKNQISYNYIKNDCINILENKLLISELKNEDDLKILNLYWLLNNINYELENYIKLYFENQKEININCKWGI